MATKVIMPQMGESIFEGTITKWLKKVGDTVARDEPLFEISTDKVDSEIPSPESGVLTEILVPEGNIVQVNSVIAVIDGDDKSTEKLKQEAPLFKEEEAAPIMSAEHEKQIPASNIEATIISPEDSKREKPTFAGIKQMLPPEPKPGVQPKDIRTSPLVRRLAREHNIDLSQVQGTGLEGRITKDDILSYLASLSAKDSVTSVLPSPEQTEPQERESEEIPAEKTSTTRMASDSDVVPPSPRESDAAEPAKTSTEMPRFVGETDTVPMTAMRKAIAEHMVFSKRTSAHVNTIFEVDMTSVVQLRKKYQAEFENREGIKLTYTPFFIKALVDTVREFPVFNSSVSDNNIVLKKPINVGVAVALETGLIVPVIKDAHLKSFTGLAFAINDLAERARTKRLKPDDVQSGTISITNPGSFGALFATPIISQPQVAILGVGGIEKRPVVINDAIAIRSMVYLSLTFDHRVIDGAVADQFMAKLKNRLQSWAQWID